MGNRQTDRQAESTTVTLVAHAYGGLIGRAGASQPSRSASARALYIILLCIFYIIGPAGASPPSGVYGIFRHTDLRQCACAHARATGISIGG